MRSTAKVMVAILAAGWFLAGIGSPAMAQDSFKYSCSAQIFEAFGQDRLNAFTKETGIRVDLYVSSSGSAVYRLMNEFSDMASTTRGIYHRYVESGYVEIPFARDPLAVIVHKENSVKELSRDQIRKIFSREITNWKEVGGADQTILVVVPGTSTAAYKNFDRLAMESKEILYDFMTDRSTMAIQAVEAFPHAVSFITQGAMVENPRVKAVKIDSLSPKSPDYPYYQTFYYITRGEPKGPVKAFIDFTQSEQGLAIMKQKGMIPIQ